jgi:type III secretion system low calcium response chaperone LcrH/SycD
MSSEEEEIRKAFRNIPPESLDVLTSSATNMQTILEKILQKGVMPKQAMGVTDAQMEAYYALAYRLFNSGKYEKASWIFRLLVALDTTELKYSFGLAGCLHMLKAYADAAKVYTVCIFLDSKDPIPCFHVSDCHIQMRDPASALLNLELAVKRAGERPEYQVLKDRAKLTIENLKREMEEMAEAGEIPQPEKTEKMPWEI